MEGVSMVYSFEDAKVPTTHPIQYFEMSANRAIYHDGWMASTTPLRKPWETLGASPDPDDFPWELYNLTEDFSQSRNIAKENPKKLLDLQSHFLMEAVKYNVLPIDSSFGDRMDPETRPSFLRGKTEFTYYPGMFRIPEANSPDVHNKSFRVTADIEVPDEAEGVLATQGGRLGGWTLLVLDSKPMFVYAVTNQDGDKYPQQRKDKTRFVGSDKLAPGKHTIVFNFEYEGGGLGKGGHGTLSVDGKTVSEARIDKTNPLGKFTLDESFDVGLDSGSPVIDEYDLKMPFRFTGAIQKIQIQLGENKLTAQEQNELHRLRREHALAGQ